MLVLLAGGARGGGSGASSSRHGVLSELGDVALEVLLLGPLDGGVLELGFDGVRKWELGALRLQVGLRCAPNSYFFTVKGGVGSWIGSAAGSGFYAFFRVHLVHTVHHRYAFRRGGI